MRNFSRVLFFWGALNLAVMVIPPHLFAGDKTLKVGVMPKLVGIDYFNAVELGAKEAAKELGVELVYDGPVTNDVTKQVAMVETWIARKFDVICIAPNDSDAIAPVLRKARKRGIKVVTFDADTNPQARDCFVNQATYEAIGRRLIDLMAHNIGEDGKYIILTGSLTAANQNLWMKEMEKYRAARHPKLKNLSPTPKAAAEDQALATQVTIDCLKTYPDLQGIFAITSVALPGAAEALIKEKAYDRIFLTGLSSPNSMRQYVDKGVVKEFILWNPVDLGYLTVQVANLLAKGSITEQSPFIKAGRLGKIQIKGHEILLGDPLVFNKDNIEKYKF